ncbi:hypothetical protein C8J57DRAFT_1249189 [Mycena rebaudengoi]|nr:hypothetical protein C8J57DRAFT_1249189 [Mycena rebaudengoi]
MSLNFLALLLVGSEIKFPTIGKALGPGGRFARVKEMCQKMRPSATTRDTIHVSSGLLEKRETVIEDSAHRNTTELIAYRFCSNKWNTSNDGASSAHYTSYVGDFKGPGSTSILAKCPKLIPRSRSAVCAGMEFPNPSPQLQTVLSFLEAVKDQHPDDILSHLTEDVKYHWVTPGFEALGPRVKNKEQTKQFFTGVKGTFVKDFKFIIQDYIEMPGKILLQMTSTGDLLAGGGKYENQYMWLFHLVQDGADGQKPKIKVAKEFFDSLYCARVWGLLSAEG